MMYPFGFLAIMVCVLFLSVDCMHDEEMKTYCGGSLVSALHLVCRGRYRTLVKKDEIYDDDNIPAEDYINDLLDKESRWPLFRLLRPNSLATKLGRYHRLRRGVVEECCEKACTYSDMLRYCE